MKKILFLLAFLVLSTIGFAQQRGNIFNVPHWNTAFGITLPKNTFVYCSDSNKIYRLKASSTSIGSLLTILNEEYPNRSTLPLYWDSINNVIFPYDTNNAVAIGTDKSAGTEMLRVRDGSVLFDGSTGTTPVSGKGTRLMWIPEKSAFRAGYVNRTQWDNALVGYYSTAMGNTTVASGSSSTAMGIETVASGESSTAMGYSTAASGSSSTAMGYSTVASGSSSTAMGFLTEASGDASTAMGQETSASEYASTAMGVGTTASGGSSTAMGDRTAASGQASTAMGNGTTASGDASTSMGYNTIASGFYSTAMGWGTTASGYFSTAMGQGTTSNGNTTTAMGKSTTASSYYSTAMGQGTLASGNSSTAMGKNTTASGYYSHAGGYATIASNNNTFSHGYKTIASGLSSFSIGDSSIAIGKASFAGGRGKAYGAYSFAFGDSINAQAAHSAALGYGNLVRGNKTAWVATDDLFVLGNGYAAKNNALTILKNGTAYIGDASSTTDPILTVSTTDSTTTVIGNMSISETATMDHLTVTDSVTLEDALFDIYHLAPDADSLVVADDGIINLRAGAYGELRVYVFNSGMYEEFATAIINTDGSVYLMINSSDVTTTGGTDNKLNIYDGGTYAIIENKLGGNRTIKYTFIH